MRKFLEVASCAGQIGACLCICYGAELDFWLRAMLLLSALNYTADAMVALGRS